MAPRKGAQRSQSGAERATPLGWFPGKDGSWLIVAAAGGPRNPAWYHNLAAHPDKVQIEMAGRKVAVIAEQLHGAEREAAWRPVSPQGAAAWAAANVRDPGNSD